MTVHLEGIVVAESAAVFVNLLLQSDSLLLLFETLFLLGNPLLLKVHSVILRIDLVLEPRDWTVGGRQAVSRACVNAGDWADRESVHDVIRDVRMGASCRSVVRAEFAASKRRHVLAECHPVFVHLLLQRHVLLLSLEPLLLGLERLLLVAHGQLFSTHLGLEPRAGTVSTRGGKSLSEVVVAEGLAIFVNLLL